MKSRRYWKEFAAFKLQILDSFSHEELLELHRRRPAVHLLYAARQFGMVAICSIVLWKVSNPLIWIPVAVLQGFTFFNMTTLLHEVVHQLVFRSTRPRLERALGLAYASTSGISASQFTKWHLDHHDNLGSAEDDPKRHWLSPKRNARWYKLLYCTPVLMPIYFRAAANEARSYPEPLRRRIRLERTATLVIQLSIAALLWKFGGTGPLFRIQLIPYFLVFPVAFTLNRLGQHYNIDPSHPLKWSTLMKPSRLWDFLFVYSNYHLEHHYFPRVPFYNLRRVHERLRPLYASLGLRPHSYSEIVWGWFVQNRPPHTNWEGGQGLPGGPGSPVEGGENDKVSEQPRVAARVATT